jgi:hypothetical protein
VASVPDSASIPEAHLKGRLADQGLTVHIDVGVPVSGAQTWDLWSALGTPPRTALEIVVTAPVVPDLRTDLAPPAESLDLGVSKEAPGLVGVPPESEGKPEAEAKAKPKPGAKAKPDAKAPPVEARPGKRWATFRVREHTPADAGE